MTEPLRILFVAPGPPSGANGNKEEVEKIEKNFGLNLLAYKNLYETIEQICSPHSDILEIIPLVATEKENHLDEKVYQLTIDEFEEQVVAQQPHVIHFYGHGQVRGNKGQLAFTDKLGRHEWIDEDVFSNKVNRSKNIKFVFLQACESARSASHNAISGVAQKLVVRAVPAVIAMQCRIYQDSAIRFTKSFYEELAETGIIDAAVHKGRVCIFEQKKILANSGEEERDFAFGIPVLYIKNRVQLFKKNNPPQQQQEQQTSSMNDKFTCPGCSEVIPMRNRFCICEKDKGEFVDVPNLACKKVECPRKIFKSSPRCTGCGLENKEFVPKLP
jgi:hypothetical protein